MCGNFASAHYSFLPPENDVPLKAAAQRPRDVLDDIDRHVLIAGFHARNRGLAGMEPSGEFRLGHAGSLASFIDLQGDASPGARLFKAGAKSRSLEFLLEPRSDAASLVFVFHAAHPSCHFAHRRIARSISSLGTLFVFLTKAFVSTTSAPSKK